MANAVATSFLMAEFILGTSYLSETNYTSETGNIQILRLGINPMVRRIMRLQDVLTDESAEDEFSHIIRLNNRFIPRRVICPMMLNRLGWINCLLI